MVEKEEPYIAAWFEIGFLCSARLGLFERQIKIELERNEMKWIGTESV